MPNRPLLLLHGYSAAGSAFRRWREALAESGWSNAHTAVVSYATLTNEVTIPDIAEGLDRLLRQTAGLDADEPFDAIVHSTGMLVLRAWLAADPARRLPRLKHLVALAPATFGSPQAHKGRSFLGAIVKGNKSLGPDFMEAGTRVLDALELASRFTWDLAHHDLFGTTPFYTDRPDRPYVAIFCGDRGYGGIASVVNEAGTDGTVRWAGCPLNSRKLGIDLTDPSRRHAFTPGYGTQQDVPLLMVPDTDHGTILSKPSPELVASVVRVLQTDTEAAYLDWMVEAEASFGAVRDAQAPWQQFVVRCTDERGDAVADWNLQFRRPDGGFLEGFAQKVHVFGGDSSLRCFHVNLDAIGRPHDGAADGTLIVQLVANTGSRRVEYAGVDYAAQPPALVHGRNGTLAVDLRLPWRPRKDLAVFHPFTTTLIDLRINRESLLGRDKVIVLDT